MTEERRQTPTERNHELLKLALERPAPSSSNPSFSVEQVKAVGGATVYEWAVHVPVCDEYPTADAAFEASVNYAEKYAEKFPSAATNGGDKADEKEKAENQTQPSAWSASPASGQGAAERNGRGIEP